MHMHPSHRLKAYTTITPPEGYYHLSNPRVHEPDPLCVHVVLVCVQDLQASVARLQAEADARIAARLVSIPLRWDGWKKGIGVGPMKDIICFIHGGTNEVIASLWGAGPAGGWRRVRQQVSRPLR